MANHVHNYSKVVDGYLDADRIRQGFSEAHIASANGSGLSKGTNSVYLSARVDHKYSNVSYVVRRNNKAHFATANLHEAVDAYNLLLIPE